MGINSVDAKLLLRLRARGYVRNNAAIVEIGAQQLTNDFLRASNVTNRLCKAFGVKPRAFGAATDGRFVTAELEHLADSAPASRDFWQWLGFTYASIDIDGSPGSIPLDLNFDDIQQEARSAFALVTNFGTTEHIANQLNAFKIIHDLAELGGVMIHHLPAQGYMNHGLVNYNPKFFWMLARSNGYKWLHSNFEISTVAHPIDRDILDEVRQHTRNIDWRARSYRVSDCEILVALQKVYNIDYVPPLDMPTGTEAPHQKLKERYWTVFEPGDLARHL